MNDAPHIHVVVRVGGHLMCADGTVQSQETCSCGAWRFFYTKYADGMYIESYSEWHYAWFTTGITLN